MFKVLREKTLTNLEFHVLQNYPSKYNSVQLSRLSCPTLCDPIDGSPPGSPVPGILQARVLEWSVIAFSDKESKC